MATELSLVLKAAVANSLEYLLFDNAVFLVERLYAEVPCLENLYLQATCYFRSGDINSAYRLLRHNYPFEQDHLSHPTSPMNCLYLLATCQLKLLRFLEAERSLSELLVYRNELPPSHLSAVYYQMAMCSKALGKKTNTLEALKQCLMRDPTLFTAYETAVLHFQAPEQISKLYDEAYLNSGASSANPIPSGSMNHSKGAIPTAVTSMPVAPHHDKRVGISHRGGTTTAPSHPPHYPHPFTPSKGVLSGNQSTGWEGASQRPTGSQSGRSTPSNSHNTPSKRIGTSSAPHTSGTPKVNTSSAMPSTPQSVPRNIYHDPNTGALAGSQDIVSCVTASHVPFLNPSLKGLLRHFANAVRLLWSFRCSEAIDYLTSSEFPHKQKNTGWYLSSLARAHYENAQNQEAAHYWICLRKREPWRITPTLVHYSTALWHLRREKELSLLTQQLIEQEPHSAITLCVAGNCYSVIREQKMALKMFQRATQVDRYFAYAHVLKGYEHLQLDETAEAEASFRTALRLESRQYLAIGGLGEVHAREGHQIYARQHFQLALDINPYPPLFARLACAFAEERTVEAWTHAVQLLDNTLSRDPSHLMARHRRAGLYLKLGKYTLALQDLEFLKQKCPKEAAVYIALARCHRKLGNKQQAMFLYNQAVDMDDQWSSTAKGEIDKLTADTSISSGPFQPAVSSASGS